MQTVISCIILLLYIVDYKILTSKEQYIGLSDDFNRFERHVLSLQCIYFMQEETYFVIARQHFFL